MNNHHFLDFFQCKTDKSCENDGEIQEFMLK